MRIRSGSPRNLATVDLLSKGRLEVGVSAGAPTHGPLLGDRLFEGDPAEMDFSYDRALRLRDNLSGGYTAIGLSFGIEDQERASRALAGMVGKRLTYRDADLG
jgi:hypothetical protein